MKEMYHIAESGQDKGGVVPMPVREADVELTSIAEAKAANQQPRAEQLNAFEKDLEDHDSGNRPA